MKGERALKIHFKHIQILLKKLKECVFPLLANTFCVLVKEKVSRKKPKKSLKMIENVFWVCKIAKIDQKIFFFCVCFPYGPLTFCVSPYSPTHKDTQINFPKENSL